MNDFTVKVWGVTPDGTELISGKDAQEIITLLSSEIQAITKHNHALAAQVEAQQDVIKLARNKLYILSHNRKDVSARCLIDADKGFKAVDDYLSANKTPQQCLAEIRAESGRNGYVAGYGKCWRESYGTKPNADSVDEYADSYAAKVRQGGE